MSRETDSLERRQCNECGEYWVDTGSIECPHCHSEDTEPMVEDDRAPESDESQ